MESLHNKLKSYIEFEEKKADAFAKFLTNSFGTLRFLNITLVFFLIWIVVNLGWVPGIDPFDSDSFNWLMVVVQLFSIVLSIVVLISQRREEKIDEVYQKMDFEINVRSEHEITKTLQMIEEIHKKLGIALVEDKELKQMEEKINITEIKEEVEKSIEEDSNTKGVS
ncbi:MAG TPA: DUF1003 domain-containing protein [Candidatus Paceibacterota bacterium]|jgi:uncharacterized membrane protein|nr:DUF1003 domain-containing protein [Candidatus Paceibacterota bacterium]